MKFKFKIKWSKIVRYKRRQIRKIKFFARHPSFKIPTLSILGLILITVVLYVLFHNAPQIQVTPNSKIVIISHDGIQQVVPTNDRTIGVLLAKLHIKLNPGDVVEPSLNTPINQDDFRINIYRAKPVAIYNGTNLTFTKSAALTPRAIIQQSGQTIYPQDYAVVKPTNNFLKSGIIGETVLINRATPVNLDLYGKNILLRTHAKTIAEFIRAEKIRLSKGDQVLPSLNSPITPNLVVFLVRKGVSVSETTSTIPMPTQVIYSSSLAYGTSAIRQQGSNGQEVTLQNQLKNGVIVSQTPLQTIITIPPVTEVVVEGSSLSGIQGDMALAGISPNDYQYANYIISHESGWCPTKWQGEYGGCPIYHGAPTVSYLGYGLCQATPGYKMASAGSDWATDPITQLEWCNSYAQRTYGGWYNAYIHWINYGYW